MVSHTGFWIDGPSENAANRAAHASFTWLSHAGGEREAILLAQCDLGKIEETRQSWPFLRDRRIDAYGSLLTRTLEDRERH